MMTDRTAIQELIAISAQELSRDYYTDKQIAAALTHVFGVDSKLIEDRTYYVAEANEKLVACGGWSKRKTLFGGDQFTTRSAALLDPEKEAAKIRAFFVHPAYARQGIGRAILHRCEAEAIAWGFSALELMSTLPGLDFYRACGYLADVPIPYDAGGVSLTFVPMKKALPVTRSR